ncbi:MAG TPA: oxidoreductase [Candidatus Angelobacter sp.]
MKKAPTAVVLGASGLVGGFCLQTLLADSNYAHIVLLSRRALPIAARLNGQATATHPTAQPSLTQKIISFESFSAEDFAGAGDVFCALGTTIRKAGSQEAFRRVDLEYPLAAARMAHQAGARQFVLVSSVGADPVSKNFYLRTKGELEQEITRLGFDALHVFRPSLLLGKREEFRLGERATVALAPLLNQVLWGGVRRYRAIPAAAVGKAMVAAAKAGNNGTSIYEYDQIIRLAA